MRDAGEISAKYVADNVGATELIVNIAFGD